MNDIHKIKVTADVECIVVPSEEGYMAYCLSLAPRAWGDSPEDAINEMRKALPAHFRNADAALNYKLEGYEGMPQSQRVWRDPVINAL